MTKENYKENGMNLGDLARDIYHSLTGEKPTSELEGRFQFGGKSIERLYQLDEKAGDLAVASLFKEFEARLPTDSYGHELLKNLADYFQKKSGYSRQQKIDY